VPQQPEQSVPEHFYILSDSAPELLQELAQRMWKLECQTVMGVAREVFGEDIDKLTPEQLIRFGFCVGYASAVGDQMRGRIAAGAGLSRKRGPR